MISYPGDILARFGRYEATEDLGQQLRSRCWRAWDPFLERWVIVATLPGLDPAELHRALQGYNGGIQRWIGEEDYGALLDFGPPGPDHPAFFVFLGADAEPVAAPAPAPELAPSASPEQGSSYAARRAAVHEAALRPDRIMEFLIVAAVIAGLVLSLLFIGKRVASGAPANLERRAGAPVSGEHR